MEWMALYPQDKPPTLEEMAAYMGEGRALFHELLSFMADTLSCKPKMTYSTCSGKPGWNVKFQKSGVGLGTLYPEEGGFSMMVVVAYRHDMQMEAALPLMTPAMSERYRAAGDYMKIGKWMMFRVDCRETLADYQRIAAIKLTK